MANVKTKPAAKRTQSRTRKPVAAARAKPRAEGEHVHAPYHEGIGRRKTSVARVRIYKEKGVITINKKEYRDYFPTLQLQRTLLRPLALSEMEGAHIEVHVYGGGTHSQAEAIRHGITRALVEGNPLQRKHLRDAGFLTRDPRMKERRKFGLKKARRAPQWSKR